MARRKFHTTNKYKGKRRKATRLEGFNRSEQDLQPPTDIAGVSDADAVTTTANDDRVSINCPTSEKLDRYEDKSYNININSSSGYRIVEFSVLQQIVSSLCCSICKSNNVSLTEENRQGLASTLFVSCANCLDKKQFSTSHRLPTKSTVASYEINRLAVTAFRDIGCGQAASQTWLSAMNIPASLYKGTFATHSKAASIAATNTADEVMKEAAVIIKQAYIDNDSTLKNKKIIDISVAFDGTWHRRGHRSHYGVGVLTELMTGLVLDYEIMSTYCFECNCHEKDDKNSQDYSDWLQNHKNKCDKNFSGSANAMESASASLIWKRSVAKYGLRYTVLLGDGDSKTFHDIAQAKPYGNISVTKEECVNHVSKRMGTALKNLVAQCRAEGASISGKGRLTQERILKLQNYYGKAIKDNSNDLPAMQNAVWAVLFHSVSTDNEPHHSRCPPGETSWCWWQRWQATGITPTRGHSNPIPKEVGEKLVPIFQRLGSEELLKRCLTGKTQNVNECINSIIWQRCPKVRFTGLDVVKYAVAKGVSTFNKGAISSLDVAEKMGISLTVHSLTAIEKRNKERKRKSEEQATDNKKKARKARKLQKAKLQDKQKEKEGATYDTGSF